MSLVSTCSLTLICNSGTKTGLKSGPETLPATFEILLIAYVTRTHHSRGRVIRRFSFPCGRVVHASASLLLFQSTRPRHLCGRVTMNSSLPCDRVADAYASLLAGHLLNFLYSFHFCKLPSQPLTHSCPIKPETLNTQIKASNGNKRGLRLAKLRPKKHVFNHVIILGRKYKCMLII